LLTSSASSRAEVMMRASQNRPGARRGSSSRSNYACQATWQAGTTYFQPWYTGLRDELLGMQRPDGSWMDTINREYGTAMACIILQVPRNMLPIFQR
jgi:hypothetical protein